MKFIHESKIIPTDISWDKGCMILRDYLRDNPQVYYYVAPDDAFDLEEAALIARHRGYTTVLYDNLS